MFKPRFYWGFRFGRGFKLRPYAGVRMGGWSPGRKRKQPQVHHQQMVIHYCTGCGAINPVGAKFCNNCGQPFSGKVIGP